MLSTIFNAVKVEHVQHDQQAARLRASITKHCQSLQHELQRHPERAERIIAKLEQEAARLQKLEN